MKTAQISHLTAFNAKPTEKATSISPFLLKSYTAKGQIPAYSHPAL
ncbi:MAG: hypothetical protein SPC84_01295 [Oscillospiraceae bacterium]|nr:hypothetical protein [Oscillospiraceae bacterium]